MVEFAQSQPYLGGTANWVHRADQQVKNTSDSESVITDACDSREAAMSPPWPRRRKRACDLGWGQLKSAILGSIRHGVMFLSRFYRQRDKYDLCKKLLSCLFQNLRVTTN